MGTAKVVSLPPLLVFAGAVLMFSGWIACESVSAPGKSRVAHPTTDAAEPASGPPIEAALGGAVVGAPRALVERQLATLPPPDVEPIDTSSGAPVLRLRYRLHLAHPVPPLMPDLPSNAFKPGPYTLTLEFDGSKPGHPLLRAALTPGG